MNAFQRVGKILLWLLAGLMGLILLVLLVLALIYPLYPPEYIYRVLAWQESDYGDYMDHWTISPTGAYNRRQNPLFSKWRLMRSAPVSAWIGSNCDHLMLS